MKWTKSQNRRWAEICRELWRSSSPKPMLKQEHPRSCSPRPCPDNFCIFARMETPPPFWATFATVWSLSQLTNCFLMFRGILLYFSLWPLPLVLPPGTTGLPPLCTLPSRMYMYIDDNLGLQCFGRIENGNYLQKYNCIILLITVSFRCFISSYCV